MILRLLVIAAALCFAVGVFGFVQYVRYRMKEDEVREQYYFRMHGIALFLLFVIGVVVMLYMGAFSE